MMLEPDDIHPLDVIDNLLVGKGYQSIEPKEVLLGEPNLYDALNQNHRMKGDVIVVPTNVLSNNAVFNVYEGLSQECPPGDIHISRANATEAHYELLGVLRLYHTLRKHCYIIPINGIFQVHLDNSKLLPKKEPNQK